MGPDNRDLPGYCSPRSGHLGADSLRSFLIGNWIVARLILDLRTKQRGSFLGWGCFADRGRDLGYEERGSMLMGTYRGLAARRYVYRFVSANRASVYFPDGRYFHALDLSAGDWRVEHVCGDDLYAGCFTRLAQNRWREVWRVTGPRKDWLLTSLLTRCHESCALYGRA